MKLLFSLLLTLIALVPLGPSSLQATMLELAFEAHTKGDLVNAEQYYKKALKEGENKAVINYNLGNLYYAKNQLGDAVIRYRRAMEAAPHFKEPYLNLGKIYYLYGDYTEALEVFLSFQGQEPDDQENTLLLADTYKKLRMFPQALEQYRRAVFLEPYREEGYIALADFFVGFGDMGRARQEVAAGYDNVDFSKTLSIYEADLLREDGDFDEAVSVYRGLLLDQQVTNFSDGERYEIELKIVDSLLSASNVNYAMYELERIVSKNPLNPMGINYLENIYLVYEKIPRGVTFFAGLYRQNPKMTHEVMKDFLAASYNKNDLFLVKSIINFFDREAVRDELAESIKNQLSF